MVIAVIRRESALPLVNNVARELFEQWLGEYQDDVDALSEPQRDEVERLRERVQIPTAGGMHLPVSIPARRTDRTVDWPHHLYQDAEGQFPDRFTTPEVELLETEFAAPGHLAWLRNIPRKKWALAFPYDKTASEVAAAYPDFLFFALDGDEVKIDLVDTHGIHLPDAAAKARGFAQFAKDHGHRFRRVEMVIFDENERRRTLNLKNIAVRGQVLAVTSREHLESLYAVAG